MPAHGAARTGVQCGPMSVSRPRRRSLVTLGFFAAFAVAAFAALWLLDYFVIDAGHRSSAGGRVGPFAQLFDFDAETMQNALGSLSQVIAAVLGIAITVVSIVVQLAATRYTSRVADMFFRDRINLGVMGFFVVACVEALWVSFTVRKDYVPQATITATVIMASGSLLVLVPYFAYVFDFLDPEKVIARIGAADAGARDRTQARRGRAPRPPPMRARRRRSSGLAHLADIAVNALGQKDKVIATDARRRCAGCWSSTRAARARSTPTGSRSARRCAPTRTSSRWRPIRSTISRRRRTWLEWKGLRQIREVFGAALTTMPEMAHVVAIDTRYVGEAALAAGDREVLALTVKFMNTYLRAALNARDVRTAYNVLNQYRQLAESLLAAPRTPGRRRRWSRSPATSSTTPGSRTASASAS